MSDPWADPHDQYPRSSSQPRTVSRDDHPLLSALSREGTGDDYGSDSFTSIHPSAAVAAATGNDSEELGDVGLTRDSSNIRGDGSGSLEPGAASASAAVGARGEQWPAQTARHLSLSPPQSATFLRRSPDNASGGGRSSPAISDAAWEQEFHGRRSRGDGTAGARGRGSVDGVPEDFQQHQSSRGRDRDREMRPERGTGTLLSGQQQQQRPRSLHHLDRRQFVEGERRHFPAEAEQVDIDTHTCIYVCVSSVRGTTCRKFIRFPCVPALLSTRPLLDVSSSFHHFVLPRAFNLHSMEST